MSYYPEVALFEGFDGFNDAMLQMAWQASVTSPAMVTASNRRGNSALSVPGGRYYTRALPSSHSGQLYGTIGFNVRVTSITGTVPFRIAGGINAGGQGCPTVGVDATGNFCIWRSTNLAGGNWALVNSAGSVIIGQDYYLELGFYSANTFGWYQLKVDGATVPTISGTTQMANTLATVTNIRIGALGDDTRNRFIISDLYYCNTISFLRDCRIDTYLMSADGANVGLTTVGSTSHYSNINESLSVNTVNYNYGTVAKDTYAHSGMTHTPAVIYASKQAWFVNKNDAGPRVINGAMYVGGATYTPETAQGISAGTAVQYLEEINRTDPSSTNTAWSKAAWDAAEFGPNLA
jgi:hypothetical protein